MKTVLFNFEYKHSSFNGHRSGDRLTLQQEQQTQK